MGNRHTHFQSETENSEIFDGSTDRLVAPVSVSENTNMFRLKTQKTGHQHKHLKPDIISDATIFDLYVQMVEQETSQ